MSPERQPTASRTRKTTRQRPRKSIVLSESSSSQESEKESQEEEWYSIKDIVAEKCIKGKLWYKIDWADNPVTGEVYDQSWVSSSASMTFDISFANIVQIVAEDANEEAIDDWEEKKQQRLQNRSGGPDSSLSSQPVQHPKRGSNTGRTSGTLQQSAVAVAEEESDSEVELVKSRSRGHSADLTVEIKQDPDFDPSEYQVITSSQLEPASPVAPQALQNPFDPIQEARAPGIPRQFDSQGTIPDSQEFTSGLSGGTNSTQSQGKGTGLAQAKAQGTSAEAGAPASKGPNTSPTEPLLAADEQQASWPEPGAGTNSTNKNNSSSALLPSAQIDDFNIQHSAVDIASTSGSLQFLTQAPFVSESPARHETSSSTKLTNSQVHQSSSIVPDSVQHRTTLSLSLSGGQSATGSASQAAQIVSPLGSQHGELVLQSQIPFDFDVYGDENLVSQDVIPETTRKKDTQRQQDDSQGSNSALSEVDNNVRRSFALSPSRVNRGTPASQVATSSQDPHYLVSSIEADPVEDAPSHALRSPVSRPPRTITPSSPASFRTQASPAASPAAPSEVIMDGTTGGTQMSAIDELRLAMDPDYVPADASVPSEAQPQEPPQAPVIEPEAPLSEVIPTVAVAPEPIVAMEDPLAVVDPLALEPAPALPQESATDVADEAFHTAPDALAFGATNDVSSAPQLSAVDELRQCLEAPVEVPTTISPAALLNSMDVDSTPSMSMPTTDLATTESLIAELLPTAESPSPEDASPEDPSPEDPFQSSLDGLVTPVAQGPTKFVVTLPLAANVRPQYLDTIRDNREAIEAFADVFAKEVSDAEPSPAVNASIDVMFQKLSDVCDLPVYIESLPVMGEKDMMRHATGSNSKFLFVHEFIESIRDLDKKVAIISRPGRVADFIEAVVAISGVRFRRLGEEAYARKAESSGPLAVTICTTASNAPSLPADTDVIIAFDRDARASPLYEGGQYFKQPIVLSLVATHTMEHIDARISRRLAPMERKNALVLSIVHARQCLVDPERGMLEPHQVAMRFGSYIREPDSDFHWEPHPIPDEVFEVYLSNSQPEAPQTSGDVNMEREESAVSRKRQIEDSDLAEDSRKRARLSESAEGMSINRGVNISARLRELIGGHIITEGQTVQISVDQLESLAVKVSHHIPIPLQCSNQLTDYFLD